MSEVCKCCGRTLPKKRPDGYNCWSGMKQRCFNEKNTNYPDYGQRGITVSDDWLGKNGFNNFIEHIGPRPGPEYSVERIDVHGNYEPGNVRWATQKEQMMNRTNTLRVDINGEEKTVFQISEETNVSVKALRSRIFLGETGDRLTRPARTQTTYSYQGGEYTLSEIAEKAGVSRSALYARASRKDINIDEVIRDIKPRGKNRK